MNLMYSCKFTNNMHFPDFVSLYVGQLLIYLLTAIGLTAGCCITVIGNVRIRTHTKLYTAKSKPRNLSVYKNRLSVLLQTNS
jgi:hypothetical protein